MTTANIDLEAAQMRLDEVKRDEGYSPWNLVADNEALIAEVEVLRERVFIANTEVTRLQTANAYWHLRGMALKADAKALKALQERDAFELTEEGYAYLASLDALGEMNYYLCHWHDGSAVIKQGQAAVELWLQECLWPMGIGCPVEIVDQLTMLDEDAGHGGTPIQITWQGAGCSYTITEITDLGND